MPGLFFPDLPPQSPFPPLSGAKTSSSLGREWKAEVPSGLSQSLPRGLAARLLAQVTLIPPYSRLRHKGLGKELSGPLFPVLKGKV